MAASATAARVRLRLLGTVCLEREGAPVEIAGARQRALLAYLGLRPNTPVPTDELLDRIWGSDAAVASLRVAVSKLRRTVDGAASGQIALETRPGGYLLRAEPGAIDIDVFDELVERGRAELADGEPDAAVSFLRAALSLWRGSALGELREEPFATDAALLEERRVTALEDCLEGELAAGMAGGLVAELRQLVAEHPLRERFRMQLMLALYRSGRQQEALDVYRATRALFARELGLEPSPELQRLERLILAQDPELGPTRFGVTTRRLAWSRKHLALIGVVGVASVAIVAALVTVLARSDGLPAVSSIRPNSVAALDPRTGGVARILTTGRTPRTIVVAGGAIWIANFDDQTISRIDERTGKTATVAATDSPATAMAFGAADLWAADRFDGALMRLDGRTAEVLARIPMSPGVSGIAADGRAVWVTNQATNTVYRVDPHTNRIVERIHVPGPAGVALEGNRVWVAESFAKKVVRIDPQTNRVDTQIPLNLEPDEVAVAGGILWATHPMENVVSRVVLRTHDASLVQVGRSPSAVAALPDEAWVVDDLDHTVDGIDARSGVVNHRLALSTNPATGLRATTPGGIAVGNARVWISVQQY